MKMPDPEEGAALEFKDNDFLFQIDDVELYDDRENVTRKWPRRDPGQGREKVVCNVGFEDLALVPVKVGDAKAVATIDSGSQVSLVSVGFVKRLGKFEALGINDKVSLQDVQGNKITTFGTLVLFIQLGGTCFMADCLVVERLPSDVLLGRPFLRMHSVAVCHGDEVLKLKQSGEQVPFISSNLGEKRVVAAAVVGQKKLAPGGVGKLRLRGSGKLKRGEVHELWLTFRDKRMGACRRYLVLPDRQSVTVLVGNGTPDKITLTPETVHAVLVPMGMTEVEPADSEDLEKEVLAQICASVVAAPEGRELPEEETEDDIRKVLDAVRIGQCSPAMKAKLLDLLFRYHALFARDKWDIGRVNEPGFAHEIKLKEGAVPKRFPPYRVSQEERKVVEHFVAKMKKAKLIKESKSEWALPLMLLVKPDDPRERRPVVNCRYLNLNQVCEATFLPRTDDLLDRFSAGKRCISKLDICQFYFQVPLSQESQDVCSFSTVVGNFSSLVMLQGDANAPNEAQRLLMRALEGIEDAFCLIDDIGVASDDEQKHLEALEEIFRRLLALGLTMRPDKLVLMAEEVEFLGYKVCRGGRLKITDEKIEAVRKWPRCSTVSEVRAFLGFCGYVRKFVRGYSEISLPLVRLTRKDRMSSVDWTPEVEEAFQKLKRVITEAPCLVVPDPEGGEMLLFVDASANGLGYVLAQECEQPGGKKVLRPCGYGSRLFRGAEKNYSIPEKECLAAVWSIKKNRPYLFGRVFRLHTDSEGVYHTLRRQSAEPTSSRLSRFALDVLGFSFHVHHVRTDKNWADALSRLPVVVDRETGEMEYRKDAEVFPDPYPPPVRPDEVEIEPLWVNPVTTRGQAIDQQVADGFRQEQKSDPEILAMKNKLLQMQSKKMKVGKMTFELVGEVVYARDARRRRRFMVPKSLVQTVLEREHSVGHFGVDKMYMAMVKKYYWKFMKDDIARFVRECYTCQVCKATPSKLAPLKALPRPEHAQEVVALDVKGPLPMSQGKKYIIVAVDMFTRFAFARAVGHVDGRAVVRFLIEEIFRFGVPKVVITDNARNLKEGLAGFMYEKFGVENRNSIPFFASSNGGVERMIGTLASMLRCATVQDRLHWAKWVTELTMEYNHSVHRAIGVSPFELHFGYAPRKMLDLPEVDRVGRNLAEPERYLIELKEKRARIENAVKQGLSEYYGEMASGYDAGRRVRPHEFKVGDWVLVKAPSVRPGESKALGPLYLGPAELVWVSDTAAKVVFLSNGRNDFGVLAI